MRTVPSSAGVEIDRCLSCGSAWFDFGEVRELTEGRFPAEAAAGEGYGSPPVRFEATSAGKQSAMVQAHREAAGMACPRCGGAMRAMDFQSTGIPVLRCRGCGGTLAPRSSVGALALRFGLQRKDAALYGDLGESLAGEMRKRLERGYGSDQDGVIPWKAPSLGFPVVVPLADDGPAPGAFPLVTWGLFGLTVALQILSNADAGGMGGLAGRLALPSGAGFVGFPRSALLLAPFFHGGIVPLATGCLFLLVLGDNVEGRMGRVPFLLFYLICGVFAGAAHILWGKAGAPAALGSAGAVAGVLGAYLVFFPEVSISMYGVGKVVSVPAYLFACAWAVAVFLWGWGPGPLSALINPAPYGLAGNLAGFFGGALGAFLWRLLENATEETERYR